MLPSVSRKEQPEHKVPRVVQELTVEMAWTEPMVPTVLMGPMELTEEMELMDLQVLLDHKV